MAAKPGRLWVRIRVGGIMVLTDHREASTTSEGLDRLALAPIAPYRAQQRVGDAAHGAPPPAHQSMLAALRAKSSSNSSSSFSGLLTRVDIAQILVGSAVGQAQ